MKDGTLKDVHKIVQANQLEEIEDIAHIMIKIANLVSDLTTLLVLVYVNALYIVKNNKSIP